MPTVHVNLGPRSYDIEIGSGNLARGGASSAMPSRMMRTR